MTGIDATLIIIREKTQRELFFLAPVWSSAEIMVMETERKMTDRTTVAMDEGDRFFINISIFSNTEIKENKNT